MPHLNFELAILPPEEVQPGPYVTVGVLGADGVGKSCLVDLFCAECPFCGLEPRRDISSQALVFTELERPTPASPIRRGSGPAAEGEGGEGGQGDGEGPLDAPPEARQRPWSFGAGRTVQSLQQCCRQAILLRRVPFANACLPTHLVAYLNELRTTQCDFCSATAIKSHSATLKLQRFQKQAVFHGKPLSVLICDSPGWPWGSGSSAAGGDGGLEDALPRILCKGLMAFVVLYSPLRPESLATALDAIQTILSLNKESELRPVFVVLATHLDLLSPQEAKTSLAGAWRQVYDTPGITEDTVVFASCSLRWARFNAGAIFGMAVEKAAEQMRRANGAHGRPRRFHISSCCLQ